MADANDIEPAAGADGDAGPPAKLRLAQLDAQGALIGYELADPPAPPGRVVVGEDCDLPADGTYKWNGRAFLPLGAGFGRPTRPPVDADYAVFLLMRAVRDGTALPDECRRYLDWYDGNMRARAEERVLAERRRAGGRGRR